jgi:SnoaL-like domain
MAEESTTPDVVGRTRRVAAAVGARDAAAMALSYAPDAVLDLTRTLGDVHTGRAAIRAFFEDWFVSYEDSEAVWEESVDLGNGVAFSVISQQGRPVGATGYVQQRDALVTVWEDDLVISSEFWGADIDGARTAAERLAQERADG